MAKILQIGISYPHELSSGIGHVACTIALEDGVRGVNYESRGSAGVIKGSAARGARHSLFRHHFYLVLTEQEAKRAKKYADSHVGEDYVWAGVPGIHRGGDCSGYVSGIICAAKGWKLRRLFGTGNWTAMYEDLGFKSGLKPPGSIKEEDDMPSVEDVWSYKVPRGSNKGKTALFLLERAERATQARDLLYQALSAIKTLAGRDVNEAAIGRAAAAALLPMMETVIEQAVANMPEREPRQIAQFVVDDLTERLAAASQE